MKEKMIRTQVSITNGELEIIKIMEPLDDSSIDGAINKVSHLSLVSKEKDYTLAGFIESYNNIKNELISKFKID